MSYTTAKAYITTWECDNCHTMDKTITNFEETVRRPVGWLVPETAEAAFHKTRLSFCGWECLNTYAYKFKEEFEKAFNAVFAEVDYS